MVAGTQRDEESSIGKIFSISISALRFLKAEGLR